MRLAIIVALAGCGFEEGRPNNDPTIDGGQGSMLDSSNQPTDSRPGTIPACWNSSAYALAPNGRKYRAPHSDATWGGAQSTCATAEAHLVVINDVVENAHVQNIMDQDSWIGLSDHALDGTFAWVNGDALGYASWAPTQPMNPGGATCVFTRKSDGKWSAGSCGSLEYVCECPYP